MGIYKVYEDGKESNTVVCDNVETLAKVCSKTYVKKSFEMREVIEADAKVKEVPITKTIVKTPPDAEISPIKGPKEEVM